jgi:hypothetical protein
MVEIFRPIRGGCYDHNFLQFWAKKLTFISKTYVMMIFLQKLAVHCLSKKINIFAKFWGENILKIITSVPGHAGSVFESGNVELALYTEYHR